MLEARLFSRKDSEGLHKNSNASQNDSICYMCPITNRVGNYIDCLSLPVVMAYCLLGFPVSPSAELSRFCRVFRDCCWAANIRFTNPEIL